MPKKRERLEVIHDILKAIKHSNNSIKPTKLLHSSNVSPQMFADYKKELLKKKFILELLDEKGKTYFSLSEKGFMYLEEYKTILNFIDNFGL